MKVGTITGILGLVFAALGGFWYWRIMQLAPAFAGTTMASNLDQTAKFEIGLVCFGFFVFLIGMAVNLFSRDDDA